MVGLLSLGLVACGVENSEPEKVDSDKVTVTSVKRSQGSEFDTPAIVFQAPAKSSNKDLTLLLKDNNVFRQEH